MGLFSKKSDASKLPAMQPLPELPELHGGDDSFGREMVKSAVSDSSGEKEANFEELPRGFKLNDAASGAIPEAPKEETEGIEQINWHPRGVEPTDEMQSVEMPELKKGAAAIPAPARAPVRKARVVKEVVEEPEEAEEEQAPGEVGPVFVRVDKFEQAMKEFNLVKKKANEIESVLKRIIDAKAREENEMRAWMDELQQMKAKLAEIDDNIFSNYGE